MKRLVADASVIIKAVLPEEGSDKVDALIAACGEGLLEVTAPEILYAECGNALWKHFERGLMRAEEVQQAMAQVLAIGVRAVPGRELIKDALGIAVAHGRTVYDSLYVALAQQTEAPLLTADERLFNALAPKGFVVELLRDWRMPTP